MNEFDVDGERDDSETGGEVDGGEDDDEHSGRQLITSTTEHDQDHDVASDSEHAEDYQKNNHDDQLNVADRRDRRHDVVCDRTLRRRVIHRRYSTPRTPKVFCEVKVPDSPSTGVFCNHVTCRTCMTLILEIALYKFILTLSLTCLLER